VATHGGGIPAGPGAFDQDAAGRRVTGCGDRAPPASLATGVCVGDQAPRCHQWSGSLAAGHGAQCGDEGHGDRALHPPHGLERRDHWRQAPGFGRLRQGLRQALEAGSRLMDGADVCRDHDVLRRGARPTAESPRKGAGPRVARPVEWLAWRRRTAWRRHLAAWRAPIASARARRRARMASPSPAGTETGVSSPERSRRARGMASRRSVCTRAPACWGMREGATAQQASPVGVRYR
jgi:hypothetical protein